MRSSMKLGRQLIFKWILEMERWVAFLLGIACVAVFVWATLGGRKAFSLLHFSHFNHNLLVSLGWLLTIVVGYLGLTLIQFAFHAPSELEVGEKPAPETIGTTSQDAPVDARRSALLTMKKKSATKAAVI